MSATRYALGAAAQIYMQHTAAAMVGAFPEWRMAWRLSDRKLELGILREQTAKQLAQLARDRKPRERESHASSAPRSD